MPTFKIYIFIFKFKLFQLDLIMLQNYTCGSRDVVSPVTFNSYNCNQNTRTVQENYMLRGLKTENHQLSFLLNTFSWVPSSPAEYFSIGYFFQTAKRFELPPQPFLYGTVSGWSTAHGTLQAPFLCYSCLAHQHKQLRFSHVRAEDILSRLYFEDLSNETTTSPS